MADSSDSPTLILAGIPDGLFVVDTAGRITYCNEAASALTGITPAAALGRSCREVLKGSLCESACPVQEALTHHAPVNNRIAAIIDASGRRRTVSISAGVLRDDQGQVTGAVECLRDLSSIEEMKSAVGRAYSCEDMLSVNDRMRSLFDMLPAVAETSSTVLIRGATGTGKELLARALHRLSNRAGGPFVAVNCSALPDTLLESELFGYKSGAFTGAVHDKPGRFALARGGTIFLDEIGDITPALQVRLLRVLQERIFEPLGGVAPESADVRVIAATHRDLEQLVEEGTFRRDLFYRLNVIRLDLPTLKERPEDIPLLVDHFVDRFNEILGRNIEGMSDEALSALLTYDYPGNIRELENIIERAMVLCRTPLIEVADLPAEIAGHTAAPAAGTGRLRDMEAVLIGEAMRASGGNRAEAARHLGIHRTTLYRKLKDLGLD